MSHACATAGGQTPAGAMLIPRYTHLASLWSYYPSAKSNTRRVTKTRNGRAKVMSAKAYEKKNAAGPRTGPTYEGHHLGNSSLELMESALRRQKQFFAYVGVYAPHWPAVPAPEHRELYPGLAAPRTPNYNGFRRGKARHIRQNPDLDPFAEWWIGTTRRCTREGRAWRRRSLFRQPRAAGPENCCAIPPLPLVPAILASWQPPDAHRCFRHTLHADRHMVDRWQSAAAVDNLVKDTVDLLERWNAMDNTWFLVTSVSPTLAPGAVCEAAAQLYIALPSAHAHSWGSVRGLP